MMRRLPSFLCKRIAITILNACSHSWQTRIVGHRGGLLSLLAELGAQRFDLVLANALTSNKASQQMVRHRLGSSRLAAPAWRENSRGAFPYCREGMPMSLPDPLRTIGGALQTWLRSARSVRRLSPNSQLSMVEQRGSNESLPSTLMQ